MLKYLKNLLCGHGILLAEAIPLSKCRIVRPDKLERCGFSSSNELTAVIFAIPYYTRQSERNISAYAVPRDYHLFCQELFSDVIPRLSQEFEGFKFAGFADNSPIDERDAAAMAGLGIVGDNMMLITEKYSSYVFLAEIITDYPIKTEKDFSIKHCESCGACRRACPMDRIGNCLSALTQKKGELSDSERSAILEYGSAWGCDICQEVCPHTLRAIECDSIYSPIPFFNEDLTPTLTSEKIENMSDEDFYRRAYSWRKKETILRNLKLFEENRKTN